METQNEWLKTVEVAQKLGITQRGVQKLVARGELTAYRIGRVLRYQPNDINQYLEQARTNKPKQ